MSNGIKDGYIRLCISRTRKTGWELEAIEAERQLSDLYMAIASKDTVNDENAALEAWARDLALLLEGKPKNGIRGGALMDWVECNIVNLLAQLRYLADEVRRLEDAHEAHHESR